MRFEYAVWHAKFRPGPRLNDIRIVFRYSKFSLLLVLLKKRCGCQHSSTNCTQMRSSILNVHCF